MNTMALSPGDVVILLASTPELDAVAKIQDDASGAT